MKIKKAKSKAWDELDSYLCKLRTFYSKGENISVYESNLAQEIISKILEDKKEILNKYLGEKNEKNK